MELKETLQKPYTDIQRVDFIVSNNHQKGYEIRETETELQAWGADANELLLQAKQKKVTENDTVRDATLLKGVIYKDVLFDSDVDQKINLLATVNLMSDTDIIIWYGMNNDYLECTKEDLFNIGQLIVNLHSFCWTKNAHIKQQIEDATEIEEVEAIEIDYTL